MTKPSSAFPISHSGLTFQQLPLRAGFTSSLRGAGAVQPGTGSAAQPDWHGRTGMAQHGCHRAPWHRQHRARWHGTTSMAQHGTAIHLQPGTSLAPALLQPLCLGSSTG